MGLVMGRRLRIVRDTPSILGIIMGILRHMGLVMGGHPRIVRDTLSILGVYRVYFNRTQAKKNFKSGLRTIRVKTIPGSEFSCVN